MDFQTSSPDDVAKTLELFKELREQHGAYVDHVSKVVDKGFDLNKQISTFHERLILISIGTISLSITAMTTLAPKVAGANFPRHTFVKYVAPAWILLLISITLSRAVMGHIVVANQHLMQQWNRLAEIYNMKQMWVTLTKLSRALSGMPAVLGQDQDFSTIMAELANKLDKCVPTDLESQTAKETKIAARTTRAVKWLTHGAVVSLEVALILLCISAIKVFLSF